MSNEQQALVEAIFSDSPGDQFDPRGIAIYRRNLLASAERALQISFPTVLGLIGKDLFRFAAQQLLQQSPPDAGDWGVWGADFGDLLDNFPALETYPYIGDCARLDYANHQLKRSQNRTTDMDSLQLLATEDADGLLLMINPALTILKSDYPIVDIWKAHQVPDDAALWLQRARQKLAQAEGQIALIYCVDFVTGVRTLSRNEYKWFALLNSEVPLGQALDAMNATDFSLEQWLPLAVSQNLVTCLKKHPLATS